MLIERHRAPITFILRHEWPLLQRLGSHLYSPRCVKFGDYQLQTLWGKSQRGAGAKERQGKARREQVEGVWRRANVGVRVEGAGSG